jgi:hypothetical protein
MKILILSFFLVLCSLLYSQGNLQFNQVIRPSVSGLGTIQSFVVPAGKVWKIESADCYSYPNVAPTQISPMNTGMLFFGGQIINSVYKNAIGIHYPEMPKWFPSGTYDLRISDYSGNAYTNSTCVGVMNVIEFNIIP